MESDTILGKINLLFYKWSGDYTFKTIASTVLSFGINILFALYNGFLGIHLSSIWHGSICVFYLLLVLIRGIILLTERNNRARNEREKMHHRQRTLLISTMILLALNLALILPISLMVVFEKPVNIGLIPAIAMAAYTTYKLTMASIHIQRQRRGGYSNPLIAELRTINLIDALVSILTLQNTLIMVNHEASSVNDMLVLSAVSSAAIYLVILFTTTRLLIKAIRQYKR